MAVPARRTSKQKKHSRRSHAKLATPAIHYDVTISEYRLSHRISPKDFYKNHQVANEERQQNND